MGLLKVGFALKESSGNAGNAGCNRAAGAMPDAQIKNAL
jgi:hypothetical protein